MRSKINNKILNGKAYLDCYPVEISTNVQYVEVALV